MEMEKDKIVFKGSHPDSLYRVSADSGAGASKVTRALRMLRWPVALVFVCVALAVFVYFLMPDNLESRTGDNGTYWEPFAAGQRQPQGRKREQQHDKKPTNDDHGTKTSEIDFNDAENDRNDDFQSAVDALANEVLKRKLPVPPVFPTHLTPEVQYGNEKADTDNLRTAKVLDDADTDDSTLKPHITQKPERPLAIYLKNGTAVTSEVKPHITEKFEKPLPAATTDDITRAETINDHSTNFDHIQVTKKKVEYAQKDKGYSPTGYFVHSVPRYEGADRHVPIEVQEYYNRRPTPDISFTSGHSKLFGISIEDAETIKSTTQSSLYNTRVSPTLPTWRDGDDTTTKKYPSNIYSEVQCRSTRLALCRGILPYDLAGAPVKIGDIEATSLLSQIDYLVATNCSDRVKHFMCALLEPECNPPPFPTKMPCYALCKAVVDACDGQIPAELIPAFKCQSYPRNNCVEARTPCYPREFSCNDGSCVSRDWLCDGTKDCPGGEDETATCIKCDQSEYRCSSGGCILKRWLCDGYSDCPDGEDEHLQTCGERSAHARAPGAADTHEPGEESAGSAPAPAIRRPNRLSAGRKAAHQRAGENESSKELLVTSDSNNSLKRNFTRRPSPSRLLPYHHPQPTKTTKKFMTPIVMASSKVPEEEKVAQAPQRPNAEKESLEDVNMGDLGFFDEFDKDGKEVPEPTGRPAKTLKFGVPVPKQQAVQPAEVNPDPTKATPFNKTASQFDIVIDGDAMLRKAAAEQAAGAADDQEFNDTLTYADDILAPSPIVQTQDDGSPITITKSIQGTRPMTGKPAPEFESPNSKGSDRGWSSAHTSPCPSGELRCVDGLCITLAQLCDGTIDCSDHADEDNCYT